MKLSICMMVKDEEKNIKRCLDSLKPIMQQGLAELIVVDTGSSDSTVEIAKQYTNKVYFHLWNKDFSDMRNKTISYATGEWIFIIDADERLNEVERMIEVLKGKELDLYNTATIQVKNIVDYMDENKNVIATSTRLFRNDKSFRYEGTVHNQPIFKEPVIDFDISLTHYGYILKDKELMDRKYKRTVDLLQIELEKDPSNLYYLYQLGVSYDMHGDYKYALNTFRKAYDVMTAKKIMNCYEYSYILGTYARMAFRLENIDECFKVAKQVLEIQPEYVDMYYIIGLIEQRRGNFKEAYKILGKYTELVEKYSKLEIAKDLSIVMYHIGEEAISIAYAGIIEYYIKQEEYIEAYKILDRLTLREHKLYYIPRVLLKLNKYKELNKVYNMFDDDKEKNTFLAQIEDNIDVLNSSEVQKLYEVFKKEDNLYGKYCLVKVSVEQGVREELAKDILPTIDFNVEPQFYAGLFLEIEKVDSNILKVLASTERLIIENIVSYLINKNNHFRELLECYFSNEQLEKSTLEILKVYIGILKMLLLTKLQDNEEIDKLYENLFIKYIEIGQQFISQMYQVDHAEVIYKSINTVEERFFMQMYLVNQKRGIDKRKTIQYILEAVKTYEVMAKYINLYKDEILKSEAEQEENTRSFEMYKKQVKEVIIRMIDNGEVMHAKELLREYKEIVPNDIENHSIEAAIALAQDDVYLAEKLIMEGLKKEPKNYDLKQNKLYIEQLKKVQAKNRDNIK